MASGVFKKRRSASLAVMLMLSVAAGMTACRPSEPPIGANPKAYESAVEAGSPAYIGRWSVASDCDRDIWVIGSDGLRSPSALTCTFDAVEATSAGYVVNGICQVGKAMQPTRMVFTMSGKGVSRSLTVSGGPFAEPIALSQCHTPSAPDPGPLADASRP